MTPALRHFLLVAAAPLVLPAAASDAAPPAEPTEAAGSPASSRFRDEDGWLDVSGFLDEAYGFIPIVMPITEPAVGLGAAAALLFVDKPLGEAAAGFGRPNLTVLGALGTDNGTRGAFAADVRYWLDDRLKTVFGVVDASVNLDFYGIGNNPRLAGNPLSYNLEARAALAQARYRIADTRAWLGLGYVFAKVTTTFDFLPTRDLPDLQSESRVGGLLPHLSYDSRDNIFTPTAGNYFEASAGIFARSLGGDSDFQRVNLVAIHYQPLTRKLFFGINGSSVLSYGDVPFYMRPYVQLRGAPAMRFQGDYTAQVEGELRWQFWERFSLVGFTGAGRAWKSPDSRVTARDVTTGGVGFRYEIARKYGLHMGIDVAWGPDSPAWYVQVGSA